MRNNQLVEFVLILGVVACAYSAVIDAGNRKQQLSESQEKLEVWQQSRQLQSGNLDSRQSGEENTDDVKPTRSCFCDGASCTCCADFNLTIIDIGGPGCVRVKYLSPEQGMSINITYGNNMLTHDIVKGPRPEPTCANFIGGVAGLCARFSELTPSETGLRACLNLEPQVLGSSQLAIPIGCFNVGANGMESLDDLVPATNSTGGGDDDKLVGMSTAQIIQVVNDSAEEGISFISQLFGLQFGDQKNPNSVQDPSHEIVNNSAK
ncbi:uncharacterized protein LOC113375306 [Ctenocephalides felis]|uniref:uncharacterized protein LOC113375306 n=1 Tax=Ctenocephalides felis TaxID=7515 RepID=UPI000E6E5360|nr:uncharacterized protein LOC113375306 [Ctenocephalides felis]